VQATPAKAFSVFPNLLCKQGVSGSNPLAGVAELADAPDQIFRAVE